MPEHPSKEELSGFLLGQLTPDTSEVVAEHIEQCPPCQATIQDLEALGDTLVGMLRQPAATDDAQSQQVIERVVAVVENTLGEATQTLGKVNVPDDPPTNYTQAKLNIPTREAFERVLFASGAFDAEAWSQWQVDVPALAQAKDAAELAKLLVQHGALTKFQATLLYQGTSGLRMGEYIVLDQIGAGGMGQVFKARHRRMDRVVALKVLAKSAMNSPEAVKRFQREVKAAAKLNHSNIVTAHDAGEQDGVHFLVMEYVAGHDLSSIVKQHGPVPADKVISYIMQAARGLAFAHSKGVVHRDIKPANLLLDADGTVKILDMGLARLDGDKASMAALDGLTQSGQVMGTVDYMAPEQAFDTRTADAKADVYSLGCTVYRLITGRNVYDGETLVQKILAHREQPIPALESPHGSVPAALETIYRRMMAKKPEDRPTMAEVAAELESIHKAATVGRAAEPSTPHIVVAAQKPATAGRGRRGSHGGRRPPLKYLAAAAGAAALLFFGVWLIVRDKDGKTVAEIDAATGTKVHVPAGGSVEVATQPATSKPSTPSTITAPSTPATTTTPNSSKTSVASRGPITDATPSLAASADYALRFQDGATVEVPTLSDAIDPAGPLTIECWLAPGYYLHGEAERPGSLLAKFAGEVPCLGAPGGPFYVCINNSGGFDFRLFTNETLTGLGGEGNPRLVLAKPGERGGKYTYIGGGGSNVAKQQPIHLACVRSQTKAQFYVAGKLIYSKDLPPVTLAKSKDPFRIGGKRDDRNLWFHGVINEVRLSRTVRYDKDFAPPTRLESDTDTVALYHFDEGTGDVLRDASGNKHDGKIVGATWVLPDGSAIPSPPSVLPGEYALNFTGKYDQAPYEELVARDVTVPDDSLWTVEGYVTLQSDQVNYTGPFVWWNGIGLRHLRGSDLRFGDFGPKPPLQRRFHFACVAATADKKLFFDGKLVGSKPWSTDPPVRGDPKSKDFKIFGPGMIGRLHQLRVSKTARYDREFTPAPTLSADADTLLCYLFREGTGDVVHDSSGHGHDGKIIGATWVRADGSALPAASSVAVGGDKTLPPKFTNSFGMEFVLVPKGKSWLGGGGGKPGTKEFVVPRDFYLGTYEVTQGEWQALMKNNPSAYRRRNPTDTRPEALAVKDITDEELKRFPVEWVNGYDAMKFVNALNAATQESGWIYRLPTSDEWEYACRGGPMTGPAESGFDFYFAQPVLKALPEQLNSATPPTLNRPCRVGSYAPNRLGLYDMHGNVREWCNDLMPASPPQETDSPRRLTRGGGWNLILNGLGLQANGTGPSIQWMSFPYCGLRLARVPATTPAAAVTRPEPGGDYALYFDGARSSVTIPSLSLDGPEWTVEVTAAINGPPIVGTIVRGLGSGFAAWIETGPAADVKHVAQAVLRSAGTTHWSGHDTLDSGQRVRYAMVMRNGKIDLYHEGRRLAEGRSQTAKAVTENGKAFTIGACEDNGLMTRLFQGTIDEVRVSKKARFDGDYKPQDRLDADPDTVALYHFDEGTGDVLRDASGNNHHGKIVGATWVRADGSALPAASMVAGTTTSPGREPGDNIASQTTPARWNTPAFQQWLAATQKLPAEQQLAEFSKKLMELNPGFNGRLSGGYGQANPVIEKGVVTGVGFSTVKVNNISPVRLFTELTDLRCNGEALPNTGALTDLSPLQGLRLKTLSCGENRITDLSPLQGMPLLRLDAFANPLGDISALQGMPLNHLSLNNTSYVKDISPLRGMPLRHFSANSLKATDLSPLAGLPLEGLSLRGAAATDLSPLKNCTGLKTLELTLFRGSPDEIVNLQQALPKCKIDWDDPSKSPGGKPGDNTASPKKLAYLDPAFLQWLVATQKLPAEQQLAEFSKKLMELNPGFDGKLSGGYGSPQPVIENGIVTGVGFDTAKVADISPVRVFFSGLRELYCRANPRPNGLGPKGLLIDLSPLAGMHLTSLTAANSPIVDLSPLRGMQLKSLGIYSTNVSDLSPLVGMPLEVLGMNDARKVTDLRPLRGMPLKDLTMNGLPIADLSPLAGMKLDKLAIASTQVADISVLRGMPLNQWIDLTNTKVTDLSPLHDCPTLKDVAIERVNIDPKEISKLLQALPECKIKFSTPSGMLPETDALQEVDPERRVARWVLARGGTVNVSRASDERSRTIALEKDLPAEPFLVVHLKVPGSSSEISTAEWQSLGNLRFVRSIDVSGCRPTNEALAAIGRCRTLETLIVAFSTSLFNDAGIQHLVNLPHLRTLDLSGGGQTAASLESLGKLTSLRVLKMGTKDLQVTTLKPLQSLVHLHQLDLNGARFSDQAIGELAALPNLRLLNLSGSGLTPAVIDQLLKLRGLYAVSLEGQRYPAATLLKLADHPTLSLINTYGSGIKPEEYEQLAKSLPRLTFLHPELQTLNAAELAAIDWTATVATVSGYDRQLREKASHNAELTLNFTKAFPAAEFQQLGKVKNVTSVRLSIHNSSDELMQVLLDSLREFPHLLYLDFDKAQFTTSTAFANLPKHAGLWSFALMNSDGVNDASLAPLAKLPHLARVKLESSQLTDGVFEHLKSLQELEILSVLRAQQVTGSRLSELRDKPRLWNLQLSNTGVTDAALAALVEWPALEELSLDRTAISDTGLAHLAGCKNLRVLNVFGTKVTPAGIAALRKSLPDCMVWHDSGIIPASAAKAE